MGDMADDFRAMREASRSKRASNRNRSARLLAEAGIPFVSHNNGVHLVVAERYDFWPGTGLWIARGDKTYTRGVRRLIERVRATVQPPAVQP